MKRSGWFDALRDDLRWTLTPPFVWLAGVGVNLVLSVIWLAVQPLTGQPHRDWAIIVGSYFAVFVLADVTTTNVLGADFARVRGRLIGGASIGRLLVIKNLTLLIIVGLPTVVATALITVFIEPSYRLGLTVPGVILPVLAWLGAGNLVSVLLPNATLSLRDRWRQRGDRRRTLRWLFVLGLPYALCLLIDPVGRIPTMLLRGWTQAAGLGAEPPPIEVRGAVLAATGILLWLVGTLAAVLIARRWPQHLLTNLTHTGVVVSRTAATP